MTPFLRLMATAPSGPCSFYLSLSSLLVFAPLKTPLFVFPSLFSPFLVSCLSVLTFLSLTVLGTPRGLVTFTAFLNRRREVGRRRGSWRMRGRRWGLRRDG